MLCFLLNELVIKLMCFIRKEERVFEQFSVMLAGSKYDLRSPFVNHTHGFYSFYSIVYNTTGIKNHEA